jgi:3-oxoacyl-[acyl-carrier protein] reductase
MTIESSPRRVLVTGGTGGIGRPIAHAFADAGARVLFTSRRPATADAVALDLEDSRSVSAGVTTAIERLGGLDTLILNAVRWPAQTSERFEDLPAHEWQAVLRANVEGAFTATQAALPVLRASGRGRIVLISSGAAEEGHPVMPAYVAAKAALHGLARALAWDAGHDGVLTNVVAVGFTRTGHNQERFPDTLFTRAGALTPQRRVSDAADVARVVLWLGTDANTSITGEVIREGTSAARTPLSALA